MISLLTSQRWLYRGLYVLLALMVLFWQILPLGVHPGHWPGPDLVLALTLAWGMRRPDLVPALLVAVVLSIADLMLQRPPGLWAALVVLALEILRNRQSMWRDLPFALEWAIIAGLTLGIALVNRLVLAIAFVSQESYGMTFLQALSTALAYPVIVALSAMVLGVRKVAPGQVDELGHRL